MALIWQAAGISGLSDSVRHDSDALASEWKRALWQSMLLGLTLFPLIVPCYWLWLRSAARLGGSGIPVVAKVMAVICFMSLSFLSLMMQMTVYALLPMLWVLPVAGIVGVFLHARRMSGVEEKTREFLQAQAKRSVALINMVNEKESLAFDIKHVLHDEGEAFAGMSIFLAFDREGKKVLIGNSSTGDYALKDFGWIMSWTHRWDESHSSESRHASREYGRAGIGGSYHGHSTGTTVTRHFVNKANHRIELQVNDLDYPVVDIRQRDQIAAERWIPRLSMILNG